MDLPSVITIASILCGGTLALALLVQAYRIHTGHKGRWHGTILLDGHQKHKILARYLALLGCLFAVCTVGILLHSDLVIFGATACMGITIFFMVPTLHREPEAIGFIVHSPDEFARELSYARCFSAVMVLGSILNLFLSVYT